MMLAYAGLPRGRVCRVRGGKYAIYHGNDSPTKTCLKNVPSKFNLLPDTFSFVYDDHERMILEHYYVVKKALPHDLPVPNFDADLDDFGGDLDDD